jgi:hypothetical protein
MASEQLAGHLVIPRDGPAQGQSQHSADAYNGVFRWARRACVVGRSNRGQHANSPLQTHEGNLETGKLASEHAKPIGDGGLVGRHS